MIQMIYSIEDILLTRLSFASSFLFAKLRSFSVRCKIRSFLSSRIALYIVFLSSPSSISLSNLMSSKLLEVFVSLCVRFLHRSLNSSEFFRQRFSKFRFVVDHFCFLPQLGRDPFEISTWTLEEAPSISFDASLT